MSQERIQNYETEETEETKAKLIWHSSVKFHDPVLNTSSVFCQTVLNVRFPDISTFLSPTV